MCSIWTDDTTSALREDQVEEESNAETDFRSWSLASSCCSRGDRAALARRGSSQGRLQHGRYFVQRLLVSLLQTSQSHSCAQPHPIYHPGRDNRARSGCHDKKI